MNKHLADRSLKKYGYIVYDVDTHTYLIVNVFTFVQTF